MFWVTYRQLFHTSLKKQSTCFSGRSVVTTSDWPNVSLNIILLVVISDFYLTYNEAEAVYYTVIRHAGYLRAAGKERKYEQQCFLLFSSVLKYHSVIRGLGFFICFRANVAKKHMFFHVLYSDLNHGFLTNQIVHRVHVFSTCIQLLNLWLIM